MLGKCVIVANLGTLLPPSHFTHRVELRQFNLTRVTAREVAQKVHSMELDSGMYPLNLHALLTPAQAHPSYRDARVTDTTEKKKSAENVTSALNT